MIRRATSWTSLVVLGLLLITPGTGLAGQAPEPTTAAEPKAGPSGLGAPQGLRRGKGLKLSRAYRAIRSELTYQASARENIDGDPFSWSYDDCVWTVRGRAIQCHAYIYEYMPQECSFAGYGGAEYSADGAWVSARKVAGTRKVATGFGYLYDEYYYCF